jgi:GxxExxY protein
VLSGENAMVLKHSGLTDAIIRAFYVVYNALGYGFLEKVYAHALAIELRQMNYQVETEVRITIYYRFEVVGEYYADLLLDGKVIIEIKATKEIAPEHEAQLLNYLRATPYAVGLLLNFGPKPEYIRKAFDNSRKPTKTWQTSL